MAFHGERIKPRLLIVTDDGSCGGTAYVAYQLASLLLATFEVHFACQSNATTKSALTRLLELGITVHSYEVTEASPWRNPLQSVFSVNQALDLIEASEPDIILTFDAAELFSLSALKSAAKRCGTPFVTVVNILLEDCRTRFGAFFDVVTTPLAGAEMFVFACNAHRQRFEGALPGCAVSKVVIPNSRPDIFFQPRDLAARQRLRAALGVQDDTLLCLTTARIEPHKGQTRIVRALALLQSQGRSDGIHLVFAGAGLPEHLSELEKEIAHSGLKSRISMLGARTDIVDLLDASDIFILPSKSEATSLSIIEAMAKGLPVVATGVDGILELIDETCAVLLPLQEDASVCAIAEALHQLKHDAPLRSRIGEAGRRKAEAFRVQPTAERYSNLLLGLLKGRRENRPMRAFARTVVLVGGSIDFANSEEVWNFLRGGWSLSEAEGVWTLGSISRVLFKTNARQGQKLRLDIELRPHISPSWPSQETEVFVDDRSLAFWRFTAPERRMQSLVFEVADGSGMIAIRLEHHRAVSPFALGLSQDPRELSLFFYRIAVVAVE